MFEFFESYVDRPIIDLDSETQETDDENDNTPITIPCLVYWHGKLLPLSEIQLKE